MANLHATMDETLLTISSFFWNWASFYLNTVLTYGRFAHEKHCRLFVMNDRNKN